jgi:hypothetical protein
MSIMNPTEPTKKVWRYLDQEKAIHLFTTSLLYLRRLDLLTDYFEGDPYEGNPTFSLIDGVAHSHLQAFGHANEASIRKKFGCERKATFVSCWQMAECESWLMWKQYCRGGGGGGVAVQTTISRLAAFAKNKGLLFKEIIYLDHWTDNSLEHQVPIQVFIKPRWFADEKEVRIALFRSDYVCGTMEEIDQHLLILNDHELVLIKLADSIEQIVLSPFASDGQKKEIVELIESSRPELRPKLCESVITEKPLISPTTRTGHC